MESVTFKVGDRAVCTDDSSSWPHLKKGEWYTVERVWAKLGGAPFLNFEEIDGGWSAGRFMAASDVGRPTHTPPPLGQHPFMPVGACPADTGGLCPHDPVPPAPEAGWKDTNPKDAIGIGKVPASTLPNQVLGEVGLALMEGALKYGRHNYRVAGVRASVYYDASFRHLGLFWEGQDIDPDSGLSHVTKAIAGLMVLRDSMLQGNWVDDRPPRVEDQEWLQKLNSQAAALIAKYPTPVTAWTQKRLDDSLDQ